MNNEFYGGGRSAKGLAERGILIKDGKAALS